MKFKIKNIYVCLRIDLAESNKIVNKFLEWCDWSSTWDLLPSRLDVLLFTGIYRVNFPTRPTPLEKISQIIYIITFFYMGLAGVLTDIAHRDCR